MTAVAATFAVAFVLAVALLVVIRDEMDRLYAERDEYRKTVAVQAQVLTGLLAERPTATVTPIRRLPRQRNGEGA